MWRFMMVCFLLLGWGFYELSGGSDFALETRGTAQASTSSLVPTETEAVTPVVTNLETPSTGVQQASLLVTTPTVAATSFVDGQSDLGIAQSPSIEVSALSPSGAPRVDPVAVNTAIEAALDSAPTETTSPSAAADTTLALVQVEELPTVRETETASTQLETLEATAPRQNRSDDMRTVTANRMNFRAGPGTNFDIIGKVVNGDVTYVLETNGAGWARVELEDGTQGWLAERFLSAS
ncbi:MAG: SH3 domain-containing protein [Pseudomonadota bacterium]